MPAFCGETEIRRAHYYSTTEAWICGSRLANPRNAPIGSWERRNENGESKKGKGGENPPILKLNAKFDMVTGKCDYNSIGKEEFQATKPKSGDKPKGGAKGTKTGGRKRPRGNGQVREIRGARPLILHTIRKLPIRRSQKRILQRNDGTRNQFPWAESRTFESTRTVEFQKSFFCKRYNSMWLGKFAYNQYVGQTNCFYFPEYTWAGNIYSRVG